MDAGKGGCAFITVPGAAAIPGAISPIDAAVVGIVPGVGIAFTGTAAIGIAFTGAGNAVKGAKSSGVLLIFAIAAGKAVYGGGIAAVESIAVILVRRGTGLLLRERSRSLSMAASAFDRACCVSKRAGLPPILPLLQELQPLLRMLVLLIRHVCVMRLEVHPLYPEL